MPKTVQMVPVYYANRSGRGPAPLFVTLEAAREMVDARVAVWNKKATYINLTKTEAGLTPTQRSCRMGPSVMWGCVMGDARDIAIRDAWSTAKEIA
jgi:hypothetical protein